MIDESQLSFIRLSFQRLHCRADALALDFYTRLFQLRPDLRSMFSPDLNVQARKLGGLISQLVAAADPVAAFEEPLRHLGRTHGDYGVTAAHYAVVHDALLEALAANTTDWTPEIEAAWSTIFVKVSRIMMSESKAAPADPTPCHHEMPT